MNTIIEKIRAEVERLMKENSSSSGLEGRVLELTYEDGINTALNEVLSFLDTLQEQPVDLEKEIENYAKSYNENGINLWDWEHTDDAYADMIRGLARHFYELGRQSKPKVCDGLEEEINKRWKEWISEDKEQVEGVLPKSEFAFYARHFAQWGAEHRGSSETPKDLEEAANNYLDGVYGKMPHSDFHIAIFFAGAKWQKEQMMKEIEDAEEFEKVLADVFQSATTMVSSPSELVDAFKERLLRSAFKCFAEKKALRQSLFAKQFLELPDEIKAVIERIAQDSSHAFCDSFATLVAADKGYRKGQHDMKEQMMKEAVEGEIINAGYPTKIELNTFYSKFEHGQKVKLIIIKED